MSDNYKASPNRYSLPTTIGCQKHDVRKNREPCYSLGLKIYSPIGGDGPGPAKYHPGFCDRYGKRNVPGHLGIKTYEQFEEKIPAPNTYMLPPQNNYGSRSPSHSIGLRLRDDFRTGTPGPNAYNTSKATNTTRAPAYSLGTRLDTNSQSDSPGPKYYPNSASNNHCALHPTLKFRCNDSIEDKSPGPGKYNLQGYKPRKSAPAFSIRHKLK